MAKIRTCGEIPLSRSVTPLLKDERLTSQLSCIQKYEISSRLAESDVKLLALSPLHELRIGESGYRQALTVLLDIRRVVKPRR